MDLVCSLPTLGVLASISFLGGLAKGVTGFGGALVMAPLFSLLIDVRDASVLIVLVHAVTSLQSARTWHREADWRSIVPVAVIAVGCSAIGAHVLANIHVGMARRLVACAVLAITFIHIGGWRWRHHGGTLPIAAAGFLSGSLTALGGLGGPPALCYFAGMTTGPSLRANLLGYFALLFAGATLMLAIGHRVTAPHVMTALALLPTFISGVTTGERLGVRMSPLWFDRLVGMLLFASGAAALII